MRLDDTPPAVLIVSDDAIAAALLGGLIETLGYRVSFAAADAAMAGLRRTRPRIAMLDCAGGCDEPMVARALMRGVSVVLIGPTPLLGRMRELATRHDVEVVFMPPEPGPLGVVLDRAARRALD